MYVRTSITSKAHKVDIKVVINIPHQTNGICTQGSAN